MATASAQSRLAVGMAGILLVIAQANSDPVTVAIVSATMPVLGIGGAKSFGPTMALVLRFAATDVSEGVIPDAGHWLMRQPLGANAREDLALVFAVTLSAVLVNMVAAARQLRAELV